MWHKRWQRISSARFVSGRFFYASRGEWERDGEMNTFWFLLCKQTQDTKKMYWTHDFISTNKQRHEGTKGNLRSFFFCVFRWNIKFNMKAMLGYKHMSGVVFDSLMLWLQCCYKRRFLTIFFAASDANETFYDTKNDNFRQSPWKSIGFSRDGLTAGSADNCRLARLFLGNG